MSSRVLQEDMQCRQRNFIQVKVWLSDWLPNYVSSIWWKLVKGSQLCAFCPYAIVYCYPEFKLRYVKNLKLFLIRIKELLEPIVLRKKGDGFLLFLKAFSWETDLWVTLGDFTVKDAKFGKEIFILTDNWLGRNEVWYAEDNHSYMCHICPKWFLDQNFN